MHSFTVLKLTLHFSFNESHPNAKYWIAQTDSQELINFLCLFFARGVVNLHQLKAYWATASHTFSGLLGNDFFKTTMSLRRYTILDRFLWVRSRWMTEEFNKLSEEFWTPGKRLALDDNVELWKGKYGQHKVIARKADKCGHATWEATDQHKFVVALMWEYHVQVEHGDSVPISQKRFRHIIDLLPDGPYTLFIDAGDFGSLPNAQYLDLKEKKFIMSVGNNKSHYLWKYLQKGLAPYAWKSISCSKMIATSYRPRVVKKCINFLTNVDGIFLYFVS